MRKEHKRYERNLLNNIMQGKSFKRFFFLYDVEKLELNLSFSHTNCIKKNHVPHWNCVLKCWFLFRACFTSDRNELIIWMFVFSNLIKLFLINHRICSFLEFLDFFPYLFEFFETKIRQKFYPKKSRTQWPLFQCLML